MQIVNKLLNFIYKHALFFFPFGCILALILLGLFSIWMSTTELVISSGLSESYLSAGNMSIGLGIGFAILITPLVAVSYILDRI